MVIFVWLLIDQITQNVCTTCLEARTFSYQNNMHAKYKKAHEKKKKKKKRNWDREEKIEKEIFTLENGFQLKLSFLTWQIFTQQSYD